MKVGKIPETVLKRSVFKQIRHRREEVLVRPGVGKDCTALKLKEGEVIVLSTDPITGALHDIGTLAVHITANDIASSGAELIGIMLTIILPDGARESDLRDMMKEIESVCESLNIEVIGGHTEVSAAVNQPIVTVTGVGKILESEMIKPKSVKPGDDIIMTKWAGLEGTAIIAAEKESELLSKYTSGFIDGAKKFISHLSIVKEAEIAKRVGVNAMHDITEGGVYGALWEIAESSNVGVEIDLKKIPIKQETVEICEFYDLNPYLLISSGCLLIATDQGNELIRELEKAGISGTIIGKVTKGHERIVMNDDEVRYLEPPKSDELYKVERGQIDERENLSSN
ncbi:AIR synthase family protein [Anaeromicropila herbilytica]|nr:AIR synthase family protein [Anaeromicropila herbilytica]